MTTAGPHADSIGSNSKIDPSYLPDPSAPMDDLPELGPDSILWQRFGDWRSLLVALYAGTLQGTQKDVSASLSRMSNFLDNEVARLVRSAFPIIRTVYEGEEVGNMIRDFHHDVKGVNEFGERWHSLNPDLFYWTHATFAAMPFRLAGNFMDPLTDAEKEQLFQETRTWYSYYGVAEPKDAPKNYPEFAEYLERYQIEELYRTETVERSRLLQRSDIERPVPWLPNFIWRAISPSVVSLLIWVDNALLSDHMREIMGWEWTAKDERRFKIFYSVTRRVFNVLPRKLRMVPIADRAFNRAGR